MSKPLNGLAGVCVAALACSAPAPKLDVTSMMDAGQPAVDAGVDGGSRLRFDGGLPSVEVCPMGTISTETVGIAGVPGGFVAMIRPGGGNQYVLERNLGSGCAVQRDTTYAASFTTTRLRPTIGADQLGNVYVDDSDSLREFGPAGALVRTHASPSDFWTMTADGLAIFSLSSVSIGSENFSMVTVQRRTAIGATFDTRQEFARFPTGDRRLLAVGPTGLVGMISYDSLPKPITLLSAQGMVLKNFGERGVDQGVCLPTVGVLTDDTFVIADSNCLIGVTYWSTDGAFLLRQATALNFTTMAIGRNQIWGHGWWGAPDTALLGVISNL